MTDQYKLMIYFAVATLHIYQKEIRIETEMSVTTFRDRYHYEVQRVFDECLSIFNYQLSYEQIDRAIVVFMKNKLKPESPMETPIYNPNNYGIRS